MFAEIYRYLLAIVSWMAGLSLSAGSAILVASKVRAESGFEHIGYNMLSCGTILCAICFVILVIS